jgi:hypothetical protein
MRPAAATVSRNLLATAVGVAPTQMKSGPAADLQPSIASTVVAVIEPGISGMVGGGCPLGE